MPRYYSEENTPSKIKPTKSLGYWKDGYLSNWLSFRTLKEANQALNRENWHTQDSARHFFIDRIKKKQNLKSIARIAEQTFTAPEKSLDLGRSKESALQLFTALAEQDYIPTTALQIAALGTLAARGWGHISWESQNLFKVLFQKNHPYAFDVATETATEAFLHEDWRIKDGGLRLFKIIFDYGEGFKEATEIATDVINDESNWPETLQNTFQLMIDLVNKNQGYEQGYDVATTIAMRLYMSQYHDVQKNSLRLLMALVRKNRAREQAMEVAKIKSLSNAKSVRDLACELRDLCLEKSNNSTSKALMCLPENNKKQSGIKIFTKPATKEDFEKHFAGSKPEPYDSEIIEATIMTPEMKKKFFDEMQSALAYYERRIRDGEGVY